MIETIVITASVTTVVSFCVGYALRGVLRLLESTQAQHRAELRNLHADWAKERSELLERIQRPERVPTADWKANEAWQRFDDGEGDDSHLVGSINWDDAFLADDTDESEAPLLPDAGGGE